MEGGGHFMREIDRWRQDGRAREGGLDDRQAARADR